MLPDFQGLLPQSQDRDDLRSLKRKSDRHFSPSRNFQQSSQERNGEALQERRVSKKDLNSAFFNIWLAQPSWSPILLTQRGWQTIVNSSGKKVPLVLGTVESHYRRTVAILGKRFGRLTNYLLIDVDINSLFHPRNGGLAPILNAMEALGLCRYLLVRSSTSGGLHIYFPLDEPVSSWGLACAAHAALTAYGVEIIGGQCELFPNKKAFNAEHNGHRLPLQNGSFLLDDNFSCISNEKACFLHGWQTAATRQDKETLLLALAGKITFTPAPVAPTATPQQPATAPQVLHPPTTRRTKHVIPPITWTRIGQSNDIMRELVNYGNRYLGLSNPDDLAGWIKAVAPQLPGYQEFASPRSKRDIESGNWSQRWSISHFLSAIKHKVSGPDHNTKIAADAKRRIFAALERICVDVEIKATPLWKLLRRLSQAWFGLGCSWDTFKQYEDEIMECVKRTGVVSLSRGDSEDVNSVSSELPEAQSAEADSVLEKDYPQLITLRWVIDRYSSIFTRFCTPKTEPETGGQGTAKLTAKLPAQSAADEIVPMEVVRELVKTAEAGKKRDSEASSEPKGLTIGQRVRITMPGGSLDGIETRVLAQTLNVLGQTVYQLEYQRQGRAVTLPAECLQVVQQAMQVDKLRPGEATISATAAQLLRVLGQACPFVGPGLWTVRRSEVSSQAWQRLSRLVGET